MSTVDIFDMTDTWNAAGTAFTAVKMDVTNTASASGSYLLDMQIGSSSVFRIGKTGSIEMGLQSGFVDFNTNELRLDDDGNTSIRADTDNQIDIKINAADDFQFTANTFTALSGSTIATNTIAETTATSGVTIDSLLIKDGGVGGSFNFSGVISPAQITSNTNDYDPTGLSTATTLRLSTDASRDLTGIAGGVEGRLLILHNVGAQNLVLKDESASSTAANRFALTSDITLPGDESTQIQYDSTSSRWRQISVSTALTGISGPVSSTDEGIIRWNGTGATVAQDSGILISDNDTMFFPELAAADADVAGLGQVWVKNDTPNKLFFTDDAGTDFDLTSGGDVSKTGTPVDNQLAVWTDASTLEGDASLTFDTATDTLQVRGPAGTGASSASVLNLATVETTIVDGDQLGRIDFQAPLEASGTDAILVAASIWAEADATFDASTNTTDLVFATATSETAAAKMRLATTAAALVPETTDTLALGTSTLNWSDLFLDSGAVINFDSGDVTVTHSANKLAFAGATSGYQFAQSLFLTEAAAAIADVAGDGQVWIKSDTPNAQYFTDDTGQDIKAAHEKMESLIIACSDETSDLTTGTKVTFRMPFGFECKEAGASVTTAGTTGTMTIDIHDDATTIMATDKIDIATTATIDDDSAVVSAGTIAKDSVIEIIIDAVHTTAAKGLKVWMLGHQT